MAKTVLLTGASRGIGKAIYDELCNEYHVIAPTSKELDLQNTENIKIYLQNIKRPIDILINNAGINFIRPIEDISEIELHSIIEVNLLAPLKLSQYIIPSMKHTGGRIVNISSIWGIRSKEFRTLYSMTKFGLIGQTKALARELGKFNILVNAICPGFTLTDLTTSTLTEQEIQQLSNEIPLKRFAQPHEIAKSVKFLIGEDNSYITGQTLVVDGGFLA